MVQNEYTGGASAGAAHCFHVGPDGRVRKEVFRATMERNKELREREREREMWLSEAEDDEDGERVEKGWPFFKIRRKRIDSLQESSCSALNG